MSALWKCACWVGLHPKVSERVRGCADERAYRLKRMELEAGPLS
jgi:hypothetical protein